MASWPGLIVRNSCHFPRGQLGPKRYTPLSMGTTRLLDKGEPLHGLEADGEQMGDFLPTGLLSVL